MWLFDRQKMKERGIVSFGRLDSMGLRAVKSCSPKTRGPSYYLLYYSRFGAKAVSGNVQEGVIK